MSNNIICNSVLCNNFLSLFMHLLCFFFLSSFFFLYFSFSSNIINDPLLYKLSFVIYVPTSVFFLLLSSFFPSFFFLFPLLLTFLFLFSVYLFVSLLPCACVIHQARTGWLQVFFILICSVTKFRFSFLVALLTLYCQ